MLPGVITTPLAREDKIGAGTWGILAEAHPCWHPASHIDFSNSLNRRKAVAHWVLISSGSGKSSEVLPYNFVICSLFKNA